MNYSINHVSGDFVFGYCNALMKGSSKEHPAFHYREKVHLKVLEN